MTTVNIYLTFDGNCREAFNFYKSVFGSDFEYVGTYGEMPAQNAIPSVGDHEKNKIMHVTLPISHETMLMGNDRLESFGGTFVAGNNFAISIKTETRQLADTLFAKLSDGGNITMPLQETFWGSYYGNVTDKFGISWKMSVDLAENT